MLTQKHSEWRNSLAPKGIPGAELNIASNGKTTYTIIIPQDSSPQEYKAAQFLAKYLGEMTDADFPIMSDSKEVSAQEICIGKTNRQCESKSPGFDGYSIQQIDEKLFIEGGSGRGMVNGVVAILEEDLGCRWYTSDCELIPHSTDLNCSIVSRDYTPKLKLRMPFYHVSFDGEWSLRNRTNDPFARVDSTWGGNYGFPIIGGKTKYYRIGKRLWGHTYHTLLPPDEYFEEHPDYYMLDDKGDRIERQICETNPEALKVVAENAKKYLRDSPESQFIYVTKTDGGLTCLCDECRELNEREGSESASMLNLVNYVAKEIEDEFPNVMVITYAYLETIPPPKTMRPRENVCVQVCNDKCSWPYPFKPARKDPQTASIAENWAKICDKIYFWDYVVNFSHFCAPMPNFAVAADNIDFAIENNAEGVMTQGAYWSTGAEREWMRSWVFSKLFWDQKWDLQELMQDFIYGYFGKAAPQIWEYNQLLESLAEKHNLAETKLKGGIRFTMSEEYLKELERDGEKYFEKALEIAENAEIKRRVESAYMPLLYVKIENWDQGEKSEYFEMVDQFERIARSIGMTHTAETRENPNLDFQLALWRDLSRDSVVQIEPDGGKFEEAVKVKVSSPLGVVRLTYTLDGEEPNTASPDVPEFIEINETSTLKIAMFMLGSCVGGPISEKEFIINKN